MSVKNKLFFGFFLIQLGILTTALADVVELNPNRPERYVVQKGDTLWDISKQFLKDPWRWASVWNINEQIKNPHLIYPGDVILLTYVDGQPQLQVVREEKAAPVEQPPVVAEQPVAEPPKEAPPPTTDVVATESEKPIEVQVGKTPEGMNVVKLKPRAYASPIKDAIPTISPDVILPFLTETHVVERGELDRAGYVMIGRGDRVVLGSGQEFYARGFSQRDKQSEFYQIFRQGTALRHPESRELLGYHAQYLGDAKLLAPGDPAKFVLTRSKLEVLATDRLLEVPPEAALPYYYPRAPDHKVHGYILAVLNGVNELGQGAIVVLSLGKREKVEEGHVLRIMRHAGYRKDPVTRYNVKMPDEETGLLMVFRVFDKVSYALIMDSTESIHLNDTVRTP